MAGEKKLIGPTTTIWWVDDGVLSNPLVPDASELAAALALDDGTALNISCAVVTGYTLNPTDSDTQDSRTICEFGNSQERGFANYEGNIQLAREATPLVNTDSIYIAPFEKFKHKGSSGYLIRRVGKVSTEPLAAGDLVDVFKMIADNPRDIEEEGGGPIYMEVPFLAQGQMAIQVEAVA